MQVDIQWGMWTGKKGEEEKLRSVTTVETKLGVAIRTKRGGATSLGLCTGNIGRADVGYTI